MLFRPRAPQLPFLCGVALLAGTCARQASAAAQPADHPDASTPSFAEVLRQDSENLQESQPGDLDLSDPEPFVHNRDSDPTRPPIVVLFDARTEFDGRTGLNPGHATIHRRDFSANLVIGPEQPFQLSIPLDYEISHYTFRGQSTLSNDAAGPVRDVSSFSLTPNIDAQVDDHWSIIGGGLVTFARQDGADSGNSGAYGGFGGARWAYDPSLTVRFGMAGITRLGKSPLILPFANVTWKVDDRTRLVTEGLEFRAEHDFTESLCAKLFVDYDLREYRLNEDGPLANGVFRDHRVPITLHLEYQPHPAIRAEVWAGVCVYEQFQTDDAAGNRVGRVRAEPYPMFGGLFEVIF